MVESGSVHYCGPQEGSAGGAWTAVLHFDQIKYGLITVGLRGKSERKALLFTIESGYPANVSLLDLCCGDGLENQAQVISICHIGPLC